MTFERLGSASCKILSWTLMSLMLITMRSWSHLFLSSNWQFLQWLSVLSSSCQSIHPLLGVLSKIGKFHTSCLPLGCNSLQVYPELDQFSCCCLHSQILKFHVGYSVPSSLITDSNTEALTLPLGWDFIAWPGFLELSPILSDVTLMELERFQGQNYLNQELDNMNSASVVLLLIPLVTPSNIVVKSSLIHKEHTADQRYNYKTVTKGRNTTQLLMLVSWKLTT